MIAVSKRWHLSTWGGLFLSKLVLLIVAGLIVPRIVLADSSAKVRFNRDVLPILAENCLRCHGFDKATREAELRLDQAESVLADREGSRVIVPGSPEQSTLLDRIHSTDPDTVMPPPGTGHSLTTDQKDVLKRWIQQGAGYEKHWAYIAPRKSEIPMGITDDRGQTAIDRFIQARLAEEKLQPSPPALPTTLLRRVTLDLTGLPPDPRELQAFLNDPHEDAYVRAVERLLASPRFGERWGRWWLDLAHYADSDGYLQDFIRPHAWRYRQWVVDALNRDLPFDRFTIEQLAGDLLTDATVSQKTATGFLRNTLSNREGGADLEEYRVRQIIDRTNTVGTVWLGLTVACAECHDHKFDAITQKEYYQLHAYFNNAEEVNIDAPLVGEEEPYRLAKSRYDQKRAALLAPVAEQISQLQAAWEEKLLWTQTHPGSDHRWDRELEVLGLIWGQGQGEGQLEGLNIIKTAVAERTKTQQDRLTDYFLSRGSAIAPEKFTELALAELSGKLDALHKELPPLGRAPVMMRSPEFRETHIHIRGDFRRPGEAVTPQTPASLPELETTREMPDRLALAHWLVRPDHPLTARVVVNRLWQELFGRGIVATSDNFGVRGEGRTHPELLDWLAVEFVEDGWSIKGLLRRMVLSETYRQSSRQRVELVEMDPGNRLFARQSRVRLSAEAVRDIALSAGGILSGKIGGPAVKPPQPESVAAEGFDNIWQTSEGEDRYRRGLYTFLQRTSPFAQFVTFDMPESSRSCTRRERSNTPIQALTLLNDPVFVEAAKGLAGRILAEPGSDEVRIRNAFLLTLSRPPTTEEADRTLAYLREQRLLFEREGDAATTLTQQTSSTGALAAEKATWIALASVLLNLDEFITRE